MIAQAVYGLPEVYRHRIKSARLLANPGCYVTSVLLALIPLLKEGVISAQNLVVDSASGVSGAGRKAKLELIHGEVHENFRAYSVAGHRHTPEMEQELSVAAGRGVQITFTPHLLPMDRGILSTIYARGTNGAGEKPVRECWQRFYADEPFVLPLPQGVLPATKQVRCTNRVQLAVVMDPRTEMLKIFSALDNLTKGASGQAIQCANLMLGLSETAGLMESWPPPHEPGGARRPGLWQRLAGQYPPHQVPFLADDLPDGEGLRHLAMVLAYAGDGLAGWQLQPIKLTLQAILEKRLSRLCNHPVRVAGSGRTDAGVHAWGQVAWVHHHPAVFPSLA